MSAQTPVKCNRCQREIKFQKKTLKDGRVINAPFELDGTEHTEKVGDVWQCKKSQSSQKSQTADSLGQTKLGAEPSPAEALIKILSVLEEIRDQKK